MKLTVQQAAQEDVYRDIIRIPEIYRPDDKNKVIDEGSVCKVKIGNKEVYAIVRGCRENTSPYAYLDERLRNRLGIEIGEEINFVIRKSGYWGQFMWAWSASEPAYRVAARLSVLSVILGVLSLIISIYSFLK